MAEGALHGLVEELRSRRGWTTGRLAEVAGVSEQAIHRTLEAPERLSGGSLSRLSHLAGAAVPDSLDEAVRMARTSVSPARQLELAELITAFSSSIPWIVSCCSRSRRAWWRDHCPRSDTDGRGGGMTRSLLVRGVVLLAIAFGLSIWGLSQMTTAWSVYDVTHAQPGALSRRR